MEKLKFLIPVDFSEQTVFARDIAARFGTMFDLEVCFLHVIPKSGGEMTDSTGNSACDADSDFALVPQKIHAAEIKIPKLIADFPGQTSSRILSGPLTDLIIKEAETGGFDLIIMGTKGAHGLKEIFGGAETGIVAQKTLVPVLSVKCDRSQLHIGEILLIQDFEHEQGFIPPVLQKLNATGQVKFTLFFAGAESENVKNAMETFAIANRLKQVNFFFAGKTGIENSVNEFCMRFPVDLVCLGTHGRSGISRLFKSSPVTQLINHLYKPIISWHL
jgi:nucleotide-binding universal stress UspA family protein